MDEDFARTLGPGDVLYNRYTAIEREVTRKMYSGVMVQNEQGRMLGLLTWNDLRDFDLSRRAGTPTP